MLEAAGGDADKVDSVYLRGEAALREHERRNGYDRPVGANGVQQRAGADGVFVPEGGRQVFVGRADGVSGF